MFGLGITEIIFGLAVIIVLFFAFKENNDIKFPIYWNQMEKAISEASDDLVSKYIGENGNVIQKDPSANDVDNAIKYVENQAGKSCKKLKMKNKHIKEKILAQFNSKTAQKRK